MPLREQSRIKGSSQPSAPPKCEPWCGGDLSPGTGSEFCKCMDVDRYFCTPACMATGQPMRPCQPVPAHEAWMLRRMANSWKEHANQVADGLASRFGQPTAPPAGAPTCKGGRGKCGTRVQDLGGPALWGFELEGLWFCSQECRTAHIKATHIQAPAPEPSAPPAGQPTCEPGCGTDDGDGRGIEFCSAECVDAGRSIVPPTAPPAGVPTCDSKCGGKECWGGCFGMHGNAHLCSDACVASGRSLNPARSVPPGPVHPANGTTCTRCGQVIQSVPFAFPPVETVDGWRHERCPEVPPEPVRDSIDALRYAVQGVPPGPVPVEASVGRSGHDRDRGLYGKFVIERTDGKSRPGEKHFECRYFVLDLDHDEHAAPALRAYATSCERAFPALAVDLRSEAGGIVARSVPSRTVPLQPAAPASEPAPTCSVPCLSRTCPRTCELDHGHPPDRDHSHASRPNEAGHTWPASEPAVRPLSGELYADLSTFRKGKPVDLDVYVYRIAAIEADLVAARTAIIREGMERDVARVKVEQLRGKLAEEREDGRAERVMLLERLDQATARVRSMREAAAKAMTCSHCGKRPATCVGAYEDATVDSPACDECCAHGNEDGRCEPIDGPARIRALPLDTGTATDADGEDDAIKAAVAPHVCKCSNGPCPRCGGTGPEGEWFEGSEVECADCGAPLIVATTEPCLGSSTFESIDEEPNEEDDESGEDAPGAVGK